MGTGRPEHGEEGRLRRIIDNDYLTLLFRVTLGIVFIVASFYKVLHPQQFAQSIWYYHLVPGSLINLMALLLPWVELICGVALIVGVWYRGAVWLVNLMMVMFIIALWSAVARGLDIDCGCFKASQGSGGDTMQSLLLDIPLIILSLQLLVSRSKRWQVGS